MARYPELGGLSVSHHRHVSEAASKWSVRAGTTTCHYNPSDRTSHLPHIPNSFISRNNRGLLKPNPSMTGF